MPNWERTVMLVGRVRGFGQLGEVDSAARVVAIVDDTLRRLHDIIVARGGRIGWSATEPEQVVAVFDEAVHGEPAARVAAAAAWAMVEQVAAMEMRRVAIDIGLHGARVVASAVGRMPRDAFVLVGDEARVADQLAKLCADHVVPILASKSVAAQLPGELTRARGELLVKGRASPLAYFELDRASGARERL